MKTAHFITLLATLSVAHARLPYVIDLVSNNSNNEVFVTATIPNGGTISKISHNGRIDTTNQKVKWGPISASNVSALSFYMEGGSGNIEISASPSASASLSALPIKQDVDNDGMDDSYETANGLTVGINDASMDLDGDGYTNQEESVLLTAANNSSDSLRLEGLIAPNADGDVMIKLPARFANVPLNVEMNPNLGTSAWHPVTFSKSSQNGETILHLSGTFSTNKQFFRVRPTL